MTDYSAFFPTVVALACVSTVAIVSTNFSKKVNFSVQNAILAIALGIGAAYLRTHGGELAHLVAAFKGVPEETRFALSVVIIAISYFGGSLFLGKGEAETGSGSATTNNATPASCDSVVEFEVPDILPSDDKMMFEEAFERFRKEIIADLPTLYEMPAEAVAWVDRMIEYTVAGGKMNRGLSVMAVQKVLAKQAGKKLSNKERIQSAALGWCIEWLQAFFLVADDVMDSSITRRGAPCWYRLPEVRLIAINDAFILESCVYKILKRYFGRESCYLQLVDLFLEVTRQTELGQLLDLTSQPQAPANGPPAIDLERFTLQRYSSIVRYKTAFYSFYLPVALGMIIAGVTDPALFATARQILLLMGEYFQVQDDYLDCYGTPEVIGKVGTDIQDNKCSWLVVQALLRANRAQRAVLEANYGQHDADKVAAVKALYVELGIEGIFKDYEEKSYAEIRALMASARGLPVEVFEFLLNKIYKRSK